MCCLAVVSVQVHARQKCAPLICAHQRYDDVISDFAV
jgi:hypothetical protein